MAEQAATQEAARRPLLGLFVLGLCVIVGWSSLAGLAHAANQVGGFPTSHRGLRPLGWLLASTVVAATAIERSGLLLLTCEARSEQASSWLQRWWLWVNHFKVALGVLGASLAISWWLRVEILTWLLAPALWPWGGVKPAWLHWNVGPSGPPYLLAVLGVAWLPVVPFLARDVWRLLRPRFDARAARLEIPFALSSLLMTLATVLIIRHHSIALFQFMMALVDEGGEIGR